MTMRRSILLTILTALVAVFLSSAGQTSQRASLKSGKDFSTIADERARSVAIFQEAGKVIQHPRCLNCHPAGNRPLQNDDSHPHRPLVVRGEDGLGAIGMRCTTCHGETNFEPGHVPGNPNWHLAPIEMAWVGKSLGAICEQIKDPKRNGGRSLEQIVDHVTDDELVGWAWNPGPGRTPAPGTQKHFGALIKLWVETGAHCPPA
jgi:hypothetical protein